MYSLATQYEPRSLSHRSTRDDQKASDNNRHSDKGISLGTNFTTEWGSEEVPGLYTGGVRGGSTEPPFVSKH